MPFVKNVLSPTLALVENVLLPTVPCLTLNMSLRHAQLLRLLGALYKDYGKFAESEQTLVKVQHACFVNCQELDLLTLQALSMSPTDFV